MKEHKAYTIGLYTLKCGGYEPDLASVEDGKVVVTTTIPKIKNYYKSEGFEFIERVKIESKDTLVSRSNTTHSPSMLEKFWKQFNNIRKWSIKTFCPT